MLRIFKLHGTGENGEVCVESNHQDAYCFLQDLAEGIVAYLDHCHKDETYGDDEFDILHMLENGFQILCKIKGYKCEKVKEQRVLFSGHSWPSEGAVVEVK